MERFQQRKIRSEQPASRAQIVEIKISDEEYKMMQFFCPDSVIFQEPRFKYNKGFLSRNLQPGENEQSLKSTVHSMMDWFNHLTSVEIASPEYITYDKLKEIQTGILSSVADEIFCYSADDKKTLILKGTKYEKLQQAKHKAEFILGIQRQGVGGRRNRVFKTDASDDEKHEKVQFRSFGDGMNTSKSSFSQSFTGSYGVTVPTTVQDMSLLTTEGLVIKVYVGNILKLNVDCIVNAANRWLTHLGGVTGVISRAAGYGFQQESDDYIQKNGPLNVTDCCTISACNLNYQCVIHAVGPNWYDYPVDKRACVFDLRKTVVNCFKEAEINSNTSVALPAISSGVFGVPIDICCSEYCQAVLEYSNNCGKTTCLKEIHFVAKDADAVKKIQEEFSRHLLTTHSTYSTSSSSGYAWSKDFSDRMTRSLSDEPNVETHDWKTSTEIPEVVDTQTVFQRLTSHDGQRRERSDTAEKLSSNVQYEEDKPGTPVAGGKFEDCTICTDTPTDPRMLQCGHIFCGDCITLQFKVNKPVCPTCGSRQGVVPDDQPLLTGYPYCG